MTRKIVFLFGLVITLSFSCSRKEKKNNEEQIRVEQGSETDAALPDSILNSVFGNVSMKQTPSFPSHVILTGLAEHRLVSVYKNKNRNANQEYPRYSSYESESEEGGDERYSHFMPGIDILYGYNLLNIAHYDMKSEKGNYLFSTPVLVKTVYYPSFIEDSLNKQPINRNYYLISVYDEDTNKDTLINKKDLRRMYHFDASGTVKTALIPKDYSVQRSEYDSKNDVMYIFARYDENKNGTQEKKEPIHVFWINLKAPEAGKRLY